MNISSFNRVIFARLYTRIGIQSKHSLICDSENIIMLSPLCLVLKALSVEKAQYFICLSATVEKFV